MDFRAGLIQGLHFSAIPRALPPSVWQLQWCTWHTTTSSEGGSHLDMTPEEVRTFLEAPSQPSAYLLGLNLSPHPVSEPQSIQKKDGLHSDQSDLRLEAGSAFTQAQGLPGG